MNPWHVFRQEPGRQGLEAFRTFMSSMHRGRDGVCVIGKASVVSHFGDVARQSGVPVVFAYGADAVSSGVPESLTEAPYRRSRVRAFARVSGVDLDDEGNCRSASVEYIDCISGKACWIAWETGRRICLNGFRIELLDTKRAGLHFRVGVASDGPRDESGYSTVPPRFISTAKVVRDGVFVLVPHDPIEPSFLLDGYGRTGDEEEDRLARFALRMMYGVPEHMVEAFLAGEGQKTTVDGLCVAPPRAA